MENIDIIILTTAVVIAFLIFIITSIIEFKKMDKKKYKYEKSKFGRNALYDFLEKKLDDKKMSKKEKKKIIERTISDMETDGIYF